MEGRVTELRLQRLKAAPGYTLGRLSLDGKHLCWTLEDTLRPPGVKIPGQTAIPAGRYAIEMRWSPRFKAVLPWIKDVPGFEWILIHAGNQAGDTEGCILVGTEPGAPGWIYHSRKALGLLLDKLTLPAFITIVDP